jgi:class 3 adenylate cyclase
LFTDVEGSTRRWEVDANAMRAAPAADDEVLRGAIEGHFGPLLNRAARVMAAGHGGQILLAEATASLGEPGNDGGRDWWGVGCRP